MRSGKENRESGVRAVAAVISCSLAILGCGSPVFAADYSLEIGVDTTAGRDAGTLECTFDKICRERLGPLKLSVQVDMSRWDKNRATVRMDSDEPGCCYFESAAPTVVIDLGDKLSPLPIFRGERARGALFIQNERVGTLHLRFLRR